MAEEIELTDKQARARIKALRDEHPEVVEAIIASVRIASPLAGPVRILAEVEAVLGEQAEPR